MQRPWQPLSEDAITVIIRSRFVAAADGSRAIHGLHLLAAFTTIDDLVPSRVTTALAEPLRRIKALPEAAECENVDILYADEVVQQAVTLANQHRITEVTAPGLLHGLFSHPDRELRSALSAVGLDAATVVRELEEDTAT